MCIDDVFERQAFVSEKREIEGKRVSEGILVKIVLWLMIVIRLLAFLLSWLLACLQSIVLVIGFEPGTSCMHGWKN